MLGVAETSNMTLARSVPCHRLAKTGARARPAWLQAARAESF
jgi:hypothetical protein